MAFPEIGPTVRLKAVKYFEIISVQVACPECKGPMRHCIEVEVKRGGAFGIGGHAYPVLPESIDVPADKICTKCNNDNVNKQRRDARKRQTFTQPNITPPKLKG